MIGINHNVFTTTFGEFLNMYHIDTCQEKKQKFDEFQFDSQCYIFQVPS